MPKSNYKLRRLANGNWQVDWGYEVPQIKDPRPGKNTALGRYQQFRRKPDAEEFAMMVLDELKDGELLSMSHAEKMEWASARQILDKAGFSETLPAVVEHWVKLQPKKKRKVGKAFKKYYRYMEELVEQGQRSKRTLEDTDAVKRALGPFLKGCYLHEIVLKPDKLIKHIEKLWSTLPMRKRMFDRTGVFFNWCKAKPRGWINDNPLEGLLRGLRVQRAPHIYSVQEVERILNVARETDHELEMLAAFTILFFAGCRPSDLERMKWEDHVRVTGDNEKEPFVLIPGSSITKSRIPRRVPITQAAVRWLSLCDRSKPIHSGGFRKRRIKVLVDAKVGYPDVGYKIKNNAKLTKQRKKHQDCPRHCYGSYLLALTEDRNLVTNRMGNSPSVLLSHYVGLVNSKEDARSYFALSPSTSEEKVVKFG